MTKLLRLFILSILLVGYSLNVIAADTSITPDNKPEFIPVIKKPCYIGCDYLFQFCYHYDISNMNDAIKVKEWNIEKDFVTGKAVAKMKARLLIKMCYQVSLTSAYAVIDQDLNFESEFEFKIKLNKETKDQCVEYREDSISYSSFELKGDVNTDPIPLMLGKLGQDMGEIIQDSVSKAVYDSLPEDYKGKNVYCSEEYNDTYKNNAPCRCYN